MENFLLEDGLEMPILDSYFKAHDQSVSVTPHYPVRLIPDVF